MSKPQTAVTDMPSRIAELLLRIGAVMLRPNEPFTWTSGIRSPIYCDNRLTISHPDVRRHIVDGFVQLIRAYHPDAEVIAGTATAGIPHAAMIAYEMNLPMVYVRDKAKGHGKQNLIEGLVEPGQKVVVIEDLISTGGSSLKAALALRDAGANPLGVLAIFTYAFAEAEKAFNDAGLPLRTLTDYPALIDVASNQGVIETNQLDLLKGWSENPRSYGVD